MFPVSLREGRKNVLSHSVPATGLLVLFLFTFDILSGHKSSLKESFSILGTTPLLFLAELLDDKIDISLISVYV